ncbi:hypothetical protein EPH95_05200 [Salicibibacter halophilus]|uniref:Small peptidoglycan-associated lipoprotein n=1 Tax=Salicibibacter halophilus TaxID=2502791 RepID=A0A514LFM4_9BACI|nr:hypothetical protein [Salicibibacter halophilus]QDI90648.1 hypothetical protein EPH95_05200 [Salicibibacter halophilus]
MTVRKLGLSPSLYVESLRCIYAGKNFILSYLPKKTGLIASIFAIIIISSSCSNSDEIKTLEAVTTPEGPKALLFIDENKRDIERPYYDALIDFQNRSDTETDVTIIREQEAEFDQYEVEEFPTLMLVHEDQSVTVVSGEQTAEQLVTILQDNFNQR